MALYTFFLCKLDGSAFSFEVFELGSDAEAPLMAQRMLAEHLSCDYVAVWEDMRPVRIAHRRSLGSRAPVEADLASAAGGWSPGAQAEL